MREWQTLKTTVNGLEMTFDRAGKKDHPTVLLLHGIPGWRGTWHAAGAILAQSCNVIVPDLLGFGNSAEPAKGCHAEGQASALAALLDSLDLKSVHVAGFDYGGPVALCLLRRHPKRIETLTLLATNAFRDTPIPPPLKIAKVPMLGEAAFRVIMGKTGLSMMWFAAVRDKKAFPRDRYRQALEFPAGVRWTRQIFINSLRHLDALYRPIEESLSSITVPTTVIWGDADPFFPVSVGKRTTAAIPGARYLEFTQCGHFVPEEQPSQVASAISQSILAAAERRLAPAQNWPVLRHDARRRRNC